jgi:hypothetical protein
MQIRQHRIIIIFAALVFTQACSKDPYESMVKDLPRRFQVNQKGYILDERHPGVIDDDAVVFTADAGARTFDFGTQTILFHLYVGRWQEFATLKPEEVQEAKTVAKGALDFISRLEKKQGKLSEVDQWHREILTTFLQDNCDFSKYKPLRLGSTEGKLYRKIAEPEYPPEAKKKNIEGLVTVKVLFDGNGIVIKACAISGPSILRKAAEDAAMNSLFEPLALNGKKVPCTEYRMQFRFVLSMKY